MTELAVGMRVNDTINGYGWVSIALHWLTATVDDPEVLLEPWVMPTRRLRLNKTPGLQLMQDVPYQDRSLGKLTDPEYRG